MLTVFLGVAVLGLLVVLAEIPMAAYLHKQIESKVSEECETCRLDIGTLTVSFFSPPHLVFTDVHFRTDNTHTEYADAKVKRIEMELNLAALWHKQFVAEVIHCDTPNVLFVDGSPPGAHKPKSPEKPHLPFNINEISVKGGEFTYVRKVHGTTAELTIHEIYVSGEQADKRLNMGQSELHAHAVARIENSGGVELTVNVGPIEEQLTVDVEVKAHDQNLADLTHFFKENAGVVLSGVLLKGHSLVAVRDQALTASVWAKYQDFKVVFLPMYDRSEVTAFFANIGKNLVFSPENKDRPRDEQTEKVSLRREEHEPIVGFILRGMKEASLKVTKN